MRPATSHVEHSQHASSEQGSPRSSMTTGVRRRLRYLLGEVVATGGMGTVHRGFAVGAHGLRRPVAIKRIHPAMASDRAFVEMFVREATLSARVRHINVCSTVDLVTDDDELLIVMDFVDGWTLSALMRGDDGERRPLPADVAASLACGLLRGLHAAHEARGELGEPLCIVHRDVSPQNVMVGRDGVARLLDFGVARSRGAASATRPDALAGKVAYMAPERLLGDGATPASDVFAASVVLWEALAGRRLYGGTGGTMKETTERILSGPAPTLRSLGVDVPPALDAVVAQGLASRSSDRPASAAAMAAAIAEAVRLAAHEEVAEWLLANAPSGEGAGRHDEHAGSGAPTRTAPPGSGDASDRTAPFDTCAYWHMPEPPLLGA